ncbi:MAG: hypothetical protein OXH79_14780, partial [Boseongicola sp.]|nr:hypothetical protein [Boseongicola sp.]
MMTDRALLYVEMSRARDGFVLLTDDTQELVHRLEQEIGVSHSALEATGHAVRRLECEVSRKEPLRPALQEWRALEAEAERDGICPFLAYQSNTLESVSSSPSDSLPSQSCMARMAMTA